VDQQNSISMEKVEPDKFSTAGVKEKEFIWNSNTADGNVRVVTEVTPFSVSDGYLSRV